MSELGDRIREKLKKASAGQMHTWHFVQMFMDMIDEAEKEMEESGETDEQARMDEYNVRNCW